MRTVLLTFLLCATLSAQDDAPTTQEPRPDPSLATAVLVQDAFARVAEQVSPSVVTVRAYVRDPVGAAALSHAPSNGWIESGVDELLPGHRLHAAGSGFFVSEQGDLLTCLHFLQKEDGSLADLIEIETHDLRRYISVVLGTEPTVNLAILRPEVYASGAPPRIEVARLADSAQVRAGQWVLGLGDPAGPEEFLGVGLISRGPSRDCYQELLSSFYLQATLGLHPECYGGPLVNLDGEVLGILSPRAPRPGPMSEAGGLGIEFALPSNVVVGLWEAIKERGSFRSPWLGYSVMSRAELVRDHGLETVQAMSKPRWGIFIENVFDPSPAHAAGIRPGDWLVSFAGKPIYSPIDFQRQMYLAGIGTEVELEMFREGETRMLEVLIEERPPGAITR